MKFTIYEVKINGKPRFFERLSDLKFLITLANLKPSYVTKKVLNIDKSDLISPNGKDSHKLLSDDAMRNKVVSEEHISLSK